jgi:hypothetical protein
VIRAWASLTQQQSRWEQVPILKEESERINGEKGYALHTPAILPGLAATDGDPFLAIGGQLLSLARAGGVGEKRPKTAEGGLAPRGSSSVLRPPSIHSESQVSLRIWFLGKQTKLQERLRALAAYHYGQDNLFGSN